MIVKVIRFDDDGVRTLGNLYVYNGEVVEFSCKTIELPWKDNKKKVSCIPAGIYTLQKLKESPLFKYPHLWIKDVTGRDGVKIHVANYVRELEGCIALGNAHADVDGDGIIDVSNSRRMLEKILAILPDVSKIEIYSA
jgi:hypothetical protein